jgi:hypothetical protein
LEEKWKNEEIKPNYGKDYIFKIIIGSSGESLYKKTKEILAYCGYTDLEDYVVTMHGDVLIRVRL